MEDATNNSISAEPVNTAPAIAPETTPTPPAEPAKNKKSKLSELWGKLAKSPLFIGKRKFVSLPLIALALAAVIVVPIVIINANRPPLEPLNPLDDPVFMEWIGDLSQKVQTALNDGNGSVEGAVSIVDDMLEHEYDPPRRSTLLNERATLTASAGRLDESIESMWGFLDFATDVGDARESGMGYLASLYYENGDKQRALELFQQALDLAIETGNYHGNDYFVKMIRQIRSELNGAENE